MGDAEGTGKAKAMAKASEGGEEEEAADGKGKHEPKPKASSNAFDVVALPTARDYTTATPAQRQVVSKAFDAPQDSKAFVPQEMKDILSKFQGPKEKTACVNFLISSKAQHT